LRHVVIEQRRTRMAEMQPAVGAGREAEDGPRHRGGKRIAAGMTGSPAVRSRISPDGSSIAHPSAAKKHCAAEIPTGGPRPDYFACAAFVVRVVAFTAGARPVVFRAALAGLDAASSSAA